MPLSTFHPATQRWFARTFAAPSPPQVAGWPEIAAKRDTLIAAPTGTGKTLTAFLACLDELFQLGFDDALEDRIYAVYVSPLKALSNDIEKNLREPLAGISAAAHELGLVAPQIRVAVRTGDTLAADRAKMLKTPPHILVTTPESLYILLTSKNGRDRLRGVQTVIVDEIHAVARDKRGMHLSLTLERLDALCGRRPQRIGLSATQKPVERVAEFLVGNRGAPVCHPCRGEGESNAPFSGGVGLRPKPPANMLGTLRVPNDANANSRASTKKNSLPRPGDSACAIVDLGHLRKIDVSVETPPVPLSHVCSYETWALVYDRLTALVQENRTTLIFVNTRSLCERLAHHLEERLGAEKVAAHHGSLSRVHRLRSEERLKAGELKALVATSSLELGIDIGSIDLVCQLGPTASIGAMLQRAGRAGHNLDSVSRAKIFPLTLDELSTAAALASAVRRGSMDTLVIPENGIDILAQQIVAECAAEEWNEDELFELVRRSYSYRNLERKEFDAVVQMLEEGFTTRRGRRSALIHHDAIGKRIRGRRGARLTAITSGGAIPDTADYAVIQEPEELRIGTLDEHFAVESSPGDVFQLGNTTWRILKVETGRVRVEDAKGMPPSVPFWFGEAPGRSDELSKEISRQRVEFEKQLESSGFESAVEWMIADCGGESALNRHAAEQLCTYFADTKKTLGVLPSLDTIVLERFFDESGGMQLILHAPFGRRVNWGWGLALRKRFCRGFNFELQAAVSDTSILISLGPQHSFPLTDVFNYLRENTVEELLVQAALEAPVFQTRWRWDVCRSLALPRFSGGKKVPPHLMRMRSDDLMCAIFPHAAACPENLTGDREVPDHPLAREVLHDCLHEAMDIDGLKAALRGIAEKKYKLVAKDTVEPSALAGEILAGKKYTFLDPADINERRARAVYSRRSLGREEAQNSGALDAAAIARVREECRPDPRDADELHDVLMTCGYLTAEEVRPFGEQLRALVAAGRAVACGKLAPVFIASERAPWFEAAIENPHFDPAPQVPEKERAKTHTRESAFAEIVRGRVEMLGPVTAGQLAQELGVEVGAIDQAMLALEAQGVVLRGHFTPSHETVLEWCDRRLLARIHRYTLDRLRREIEPVGPRDFMRFLFAWQHAAPGAQVEGPRGVSEVVAQLQGFEIAAAAWEREVLHARVKSYDSRWLDQLSHSGEITWGRRIPATPDPDGKPHGGQVRAARVGLYLREQLEMWLTLAPELPAEETHLSSAARAVLEQLRRRGAMFFQNLVRETRRLPVEIENALGELAAGGLVTCDGFSGLRALLLSSAQRRRLRKLRSPTHGGYMSGRARATLRLVKRSGGPGGMENSGRWSLFRGDGQPDLFGELKPEDVNEIVARQLLRRWGIVFHRLIAREKGLPQWLDLLRVFRRLEARGEIRGGRFVTGFSGEQYALPEAVERVRAVRDTRPDGALVALSAADPLNFTGILLPGEKIASRPSTRIVFKDGIPAAVRESGAIRILQQEHVPDEATLRAAFVRKAI